VAVRIPTSADLPTYDPRPATRLPQIPDADPVAAAQVKFGQGVSAVGGALVDVADDQRRKQNAVNSALAEADLTANLFRTKEAIKNEVDPAKIDVLKGQLNGFIERAGATITDPEHRQLWAAKARLKAVDVENAAHQQQLGIWNDRFKAGAQAQIEEQIRIAAQAPDPEEREAAKRRIGEIIGSMQSAGVLTATKSQAALSEIGEKMIVGHADWLSASGRHGEAAAHLQQNGRFVDPQRLRTYTDYLKPRVDKEAGVSLLDRTAPGAAPIRGGSVERFLDLTEQHESRGKNVEQGIVPAGGGYNPSVGRVTGPSTASGHFQITDSTWKNFAAGAGIDLKEYPRAIAAPYDVQRKVARHIATTDGVQHWTNYNKSLKAAVQAEGLPVSGRVGGVASADAATEAEINAAPAVGASIPLDTEPAAPKVPDWQAWMQRIDATPGYTREQKEHAKAELRQRHNEFALGQSEAASDLQLAIGRGEKSREDIEAAYQAGRISPEKRTQLHGYFDKLDEQRGLESEAMLRVGAAGNGGAPLDPKSKYYRKALDFHYSRVAKTWAAAAPEQVVDRSVAYAAQYGMVPETLQSTIRGGLHSGQADKAVLATEIVSRLRNSNPQLLNEFAEEDLRLANGIRAYQESGMPAEQAYQRATESMKVSKAEKEARAEEWKTVRGKTEEDRRRSDERFINSKQNSIFMDDPNNVPSVMRREFADIAKSEFERTGNLDASRQMALDTINRVWGRTGVGADGLRYERLAPEKFYGIPTMTQEQNSAWMNEQLVADVSRGAFVDPKFPITANRILIRPALKSAPDGKPVYHLMLQDAAGIFHNVTVTGPDGKEKLREWVPDWSRSAEAQRQREGRTLTIDQLRQQRIQPNVLGTPAGRLMEDVR
jgi:hypothetical protein